MKVSANASAYYYQLDPIFSQDGEPGGNAMWTGIGASAMGLKGRLDLEAFHNMLYGRDPSGESRLVGKDTGKQAHHKNAATDIPLTAPKSFSVAALFDPSLREAVQNAAIKTAEHVEANHVFGRQTFDGKTEMVQGMMIAALFMHGTSRAEDVHVHGHLVIQNMVIRPDGSFCTLENRPIFRNQSAITQSFYSFLANEAKSLGYGIELHKGTAGQMIPELAGYRQEVNDLFSKRHEAIRGADQLRNDLEKRLQHLPVEAREALIQLQTKCEKNPKLTETEIVNRHIQQLDSIGIIPAEYLSEMKAVGQKLNAKESLEQNGLDQNENRNCETSLIDSYHKVAKGPNLAADSTALETIYTERLEELKAESARINEGENKELTQGVLVDNERSDELQNQQDHELAI